MVDATRFWVHGCEPGRVSDGSRLALCQTLSIECPSSIFFWHVYFCYSCSFLFVVFCVFVFFFCSHWSVVDVPLIFFCPADHVPDWQPRILLGMVEARSVNVKKTTTICISLTADGSQRARLPIPPTATVPSCLWLLRIFQSLLGSHLTRFTGCG